MQGIWAASGICTHPAKVLPKVEEPPVPHLRENLSSEEKDMVRHDFLRFGVRVKTASEDPSQFYPAMTCTVTFSSLSPR